MNTRKINILIAEDNPLLAESLAYKLKNIGHITTCSSPERAIKTLGKNHFDIAFIDLSLEEEFDGLEILKVREIIGLMAITKVPRTPEFVRGVINLRGKVIPVIDLRLKFSMESTADTRQTCIVVVDVASGEQSLMTGITVDSVSEVLDIVDEQIEEAPTFGTGIDTDYILGIGKIKEEVKILLDIDKVLDVTTMAMLANQSASAMPAEGPEVMEGQLEAAGV